MISNSEYKKLLELAEKKLNKFKNRLVFKRYNTDNSGQKIIQNVNMEINAVDVVHDLIIKYPVLSFLELKNKIPGQIFKNYWENRHAANPEYRSWDNTMGSRMRREKNKERLRDPVLIEVRKKYMQKYYKKRIKDPAKLSKIKSNVLKNNIVRNEKLKEDPNYKKQMYSQQKQYRKKRNEKQDLQPGNDEKH